MITVLEGKNVDVIQPFPVKEIDAAIGWLHCYKTLILGDEGPANDEQTAEFLRLCVNNIHTWGIIDKFNLTKATKTDVPIVGLVMFEQTSPTDGWFHITSNRRAWGSKLIQPSLAQEAGELVVSNLFENTGLTRLSSITTANNKAAYAMLKQLGFVKDGYFKDSVVQGGEVKDTIHFGRVRNYVSIQTA